jgi:hypothetical protein
MCWIAMANASVSRVQPVSRVIDGNSSPMVVLGPNVTIAMRHPQMTMKIGALKMPAARRMLIRQAHLTRPKPA